VDARAVEVVVDRQAGRRPGLARVFFGTLLAVVAGRILALLALAAPSIVGQADVVAVDSLPFLAQSPAAVLADGAVLLVGLWACTLVVRALLGSAFDAWPAWTWTGLTLAAGLALALVGPVTVGGGAALAGLALRWTAYREDGTARPEPWTFSRRWAPAVGLAVPVVALGGATAYGMYHPLALSAADTGVPIRASREPLDVMATLHNEGGRPLRVLAIEPGDERGFALHLVGAQRQFPGVTEAGDLGERPLALPFTIAPHQSRGDLVLRVSRAGCHPGASGRINSIRIRYALGGERSTLLPLGTPLTLTC
jgi:hypothetical protein